MGLSFFQIHGNWCLAPVIEREMTTKYNEDLTFATQGSVQYLRELITLADRFDGPISGLRAIVEFVL